MHCQPVRFEEGDIRRAAVDDTTWRSAWGSDFRPIPGCGISATPKIGILSGSAAHASQGDLRAAETLHAVACPSPARPGIGKLCNQEIPDGIDP